MAQLKDTVVSGSLRATDSLLTLTLQTKIIKVPATAGGSDYSTGTNKYVLLSNGSSAYWGTATVITEVGTISVGKWQGTTIATGYGGTGVTSHTANRLVWSTSATTIQAGYHYANTTKIAINSASEPSYNFYVNGTSYFSNTVSVPSTLMVRAQNTTTEGGEICLAADPNNSSYAAYLDVCSNYFRVHSNGEERFSVNLSSYGTSKFTGLLQITKNSNTVTIGSANTSFCHFSNSADIPFWFNKTIQIDGSCLPYTNKTGGSCGSTSKYWNGIYSYKKMYIVSNESTDDSTYLMFYASDNSTRAQIIWNGNCTNEKDNNNYMKLKTSYGDIRLEPASASVRVAGTLDVHPSTGSYTEGIRIYPTGSWATFMLLGNDKTTTTDTSANSWGVFNNNGNFYITRYGSSSSAADAQRSEFSSVSNQWRLRCYVQAHKAGIYRSGLHIYGPTYGNTAADMASGTAGLFSWNDGGPQITFDTNETPGGGQAGALIYTDHDTAATGASWHFVSNQGDWNVTSKRFHARTSISIGTNLPSTSYNLSVTGTSYFSDNVTIASGKRIGCSGGSLYIGNSGNESWVYIQDMASQTSADNWKITQAGVIYSKDTRGGNLRMTSNWLGFYQNANAADSRYGYIQCNVDRMYFRKENGVSTYHFDFNGHLYTTGNLYITGNNNGIYYVGSKATYRMIRFIDNSSDIYGNGISIGGGGLAIFGSGESADTMVSNLGYTGGSEVTVIASDGNIEFYPAQNSYDAAAHHTISANGFWAGIDGNTTREIDIGVRSGSGTMYMYATASTTGGRGIWVPAHGTGGGKSVFAVDTNNNCTFYGNCTGSAGSVAWANTGHPSTFPPSSHTHNINDIKWPASHNLVCSGANTEWSIDMASDATGSYWHVWSGVNSATVLSCYNSTRYVYIPVHLAVGGYDNTSYGLSASSICSNGTLHGNAAITAGTYVYAATYLQAETYVYLGAGYPVRMRYNNAWWDILRNYNNGNTGLDAAGSGVYLGHSNTTLIDFMHGKGSIDSSGNMWVNGSFQIGASSVAYHWVLGAGGSYAWCDVRNASNTVLQNIVVYSTYMQFKEIHANKVTGAVWNDFAEFREGTTTEPGRVVATTAESNKVSLTSKRLQPCAHIISDTYGCSVGASDTAKTPLCMAGRVLVYPYRNRNEYKVGDVLCAAPNGTADIMSRDEVMLYPDRIIGIVDEIPNYEIWQQTSSAKNIHEKTIHTDIPVNGRIWVYIK